MAVAIIESRTLRILDYWSSGKCICLVFKSSQVHSQLWMKTIKDVSIKHSHWKVWVQEISENSCVSNIHQAMGNAQNYIRINPCKHIQDCWDFCTNIHWTPMLCRVSVYLRTQLMQVPTTNFARNIELCPWIQHYIICYYS